MYGINSKVSVEVKFLSKKTSSVEQNLSHLLEKQANLVTKILMILCLVGLLVNLVAASKNASITMSFVNNYLIWLVV